MPFLNPVKKPMEGKGQLVLKYLPAVSLEQYCSQVSFSLKRLWAGKLPDWHISPNHQVNHSLVCTQGHSTLQLCYHPCSIYNLSCGEIPGRYQKNHPSSNRSKKQIDKYMSTSQECKIKTDFPQTQKWTCVLYFLIDIFWNESNDWIAM